MGYNSVVFICNDDADVITADPGGWWRKAWEKLCDSAGRIRPHRERTFGHGTAGNGFEAVSNFHADNYVLIIAGGNYATVVDVVRVGNEGHHTEEQQLALLRKVLDRKGYYIAKKPRRRKKG